MVLIVERRNVSNEALRDGGRAKLVANPKSLSIRLFGVSSLARPHRSQL
jgi:hypothetical protein